MQCSLRAVLNQCAGEGPTALPAPGAEQQRQLRPRVLERRSPSSRELISSAPTQVAPLLHSPWHSLSAGRILSPAQRSLRRPLPPLEPLRLSSSPSAPAR